MHGDFTFNPPCIDLHLFKVHAPSHAGLPDLGVLLNLFHDAARKLSGRMCTRSSADLGQIIVACCLVLEVKAGRCNGRSA